MNHESFPTKKGATKKPESVFDRLDTQRLLAPRWEQNQPNKKQSSKRDEPEMSALRKHIADMEAKHKGAIEEYLTNCHYPFIEDILA